MANKNSTKPRGRDAETDKLIPAEEEQKRPGTRAIDEIDTPERDGNENGVGRQLIGKRHS